MCLDELFGGFHYEQVVQDRNLRPDHVPVDIAKVLLESRNPSHQGTALVASYFFQTCAPEYCSVLSVTSIYWKIGILDDSGPIDLLVLPGISAKLCDGSEPTSSASLLPDMVGVTTTPAAPDMGAFSSSFSERGCSLSHRPIWD